MNVLNELKNRGVEDILIAGTGGLTGFPDAIRAVHPNTRIQLLQAIFGWPVNLVRNSTKFVLYKDLKVICADLKGIYTAPSEKAGCEALEDFGIKWNARYPMIYRSSTTRWKDLNEFINYPPEIRRAIYTKKAIELLDFQLRKFTKKRTSFPNDDAILNVIYLAIRNVSVKWTMPIRDWL